MTCGCAPCTVLMFPTAFGWSFSNCYRLTIRSSGGWSWLLLHHSWSVCFFQRETTDPFWEFESPGELVPYSALYVSVRAITYWGASSSARALLHSPPSIPSPPTNPRVFVSYNRNPVEENQVSFVHNFLLLHQHKSLH